MNKIFFSCLICLLLVGNLDAQIKISKQDWQADLKFLQNTVHKDYPFLFKKITAKEFDAKVAELHAAIPNMQEHEIVTGLARIVSLFQYGHTSLSVRGSRASFHMLPINLYSFKDGLFVEGARKEHEKILGAQLIEVEGMPVEKALAAVRPVVPAENDQFFKAHGLAYLCIPEVLHAQGVIEKLTNEITLTLVKGGKTFKYMVTAVNSRHFPIRYGFAKAGGSWLSIRDQKESPLYLKKINKKYFMEYLPEKKTVYIRHSQIQDDSQEPIPAFYKRVFDFVEENDVEKLVIDLRLNGGGNNYKNKPIVTGIIRTTKINQKGKLFVIIGRRTFSACQNLVNELDNYTNAIFVGEPTGENINFYGDNRTVRLPHSKIPVRLSFAWWQDKPQWENGDWTPPHVAVEMTVDDYRTNRDPVLETVLSFKDDNFVIDPVGYLRELFMAGKMKKLQSEAQRLVKDPRYRFYDFEGKLNQAGYDLLKSIRVKEAIYVFKLNTELFPKSASAWDSLAEAHGKTKQFDKAVEYYNKAIELDPKGSVGDNARKMLEKIKATKAKTDSDQES
jgi:tetratricopeptide (TPR) repeat protein